MVNCSRNTQKNSSHFKACFRIFIQVMMSDVLCNVLNLIRPVNAQQDHFTEYLNLKKMEFDSMFVKLSELAVIQTNEAFYNSRTALRIPPDYPYLERDVRKIQKTLAENMFKFLEVLFELGSFGQQCIFEILPEIHNAFNLWSNQIHTTIIQEWKEFLTRIGPAGQLFIATLKDNTDIECSDLLVVL